MPGGDDGLTLLMCYLLPWHEEDSAELRDAMAVALLAYLHPHVDEESTRLQALLAAVDMHQTASNGRPEDAYKVKDVTLEILEREVRRPQRCERDGGPFAWTRSHPLPLFPSGLLQHDAGGCGTPPGLWQPHFHQSGRLRVVRSGASMRREWSDHDEKTCASCCRS